MDGRFNHKAILLAGGYNKAHPLSITSSSVVTRESVRLPFLIDVLKDLDIFSCDVGNAYLNAMC